MRLIDSPDVVEKSLHLHGKICLPGALPSLCSLFAPPHSSSFLSSSLPLGLNIMHIKTLPGFIKGKLLVSWSNTSSFSRWSKIPFSFRNIYEIWLNIWESGCQRNARKFQVGMTRQTSWFSRKRVVEFSAFVAIFGPVHSKKAMNIQNELFFFAWISEVQVQGSTLVDLETDINRLRQW